MISPYTEDTDTKLSIQEGGKVEIFRPKLTYTDLGFNTYDLTLNIQLPEAPDIGVVCVNKLLRISLSGVKSILDYGDIEPTCEINTFPNLETGLCVYSFTDSRIYQLEYYSAGGVNMFSATGVHRTQVVNPDLWEFDFFLTRPADDAITDESIKPMDSKSMLTKNPLISNFVDQVRQQEASLGGNRENIHTVLGLVPGGYIRITIKKLKVNPDISDIKADMLILKMQLTNDDNAISAQSSNPAITDFLNNAKKYNQLIGDTPVGSTLSIKNPITSQTDILTKFGKIVGNNKALYQQLYMYFFMGINFQTIIRHGENLLQTLKHYAKLCHCNLNKELIKVI